MVTAEMCKKILGPNCPLSDEEIDRLLADAQSFCEIMLPLIAKSVKEDKQNMQKPDVSGPYF